MATNKEISCDIIWDVARIFGLGGLILSKVRANIFLSEKKIRLQRALSKGQI